jgi:hypothetical protein
MDGSRVGCLHAPTGDVDMERCLGCVHLVEEHLNEARAWIRCQAGPPRYGAVTIPPPARTSSVSGPISLGAVRAEPQ